MIIKLTEQQYRWLSEVRDVIDEGVEWTNNNGTINLSINQNTDDASNKGKNSVDTRVFGTKQDILYGDGTGRKNSRTLDTYNSTRKAHIEFYKSIIDYINNGREGEINVPEDLDKRSYTTVKNWFDNGYSDNRIIDLCKKKISNKQNDSSQYFQTHERISQEDDKSDKVARYLTGAVPHTNVKYISLFSMDDFNFSDAIKHGRVRQNDKIDSLLGIEKSERELDNYGNLKELPITYDNNVTPNIAQNFSLNGVNGKDHYKQSFGLNGNGGYTSVSQFLDKSVMYAKYALDKESFHADVIVSAPSSSKFNKYYCTNLSNKLGIPYIDDFFQRNMVNVRFDDGRDISALRNEGFSQTEIDKFAREVKSIAYKEIAYFITEPVKAFIQKNYRALEAIRIQKYSRELITIEQITTCVTKHAYETLIPFLKSDALTTNLVQNFMNTDIKVKSKSYDSKYIIESFLNLVNKNEFNSVIQQMFTICQQYTEQLKNNGYKLKSIGSKRFKITHIEKQFRPYLNNVYVVADKYVSENGKLFSRYKNAKFVIFDEDINSGATLKLAIDALREKIPENQDNNIICLVNAYSGSGW